MFKLGRLATAEEYFTGSAARANGSVYVCRLVDYSPEIHAFLKNYLEETKKRGVFIGGKLQNPTEQQLDYFEEILGCDFQIDRQFLDIALKRWLPRLSLAQRDCLITSLYFVLDEMRKSGKNSNMLKNAYTKFMCWLYYKFERVLNFLGKEEIPKVLYEGYVSDYELKLMRILAGAGCDILLLQPSGDELYRKVDRESLYSQIVPNSAPQPFPQGFSILMLQREMDQASRMSQIQLEEPDKLSAPNIWLTGDVFEDSLKPFERRGYDNSYYYNIFTRLRGAADPSSYLNDLFRWRLKLQGLERSVLVVENRIQVPGAEETQKIKRKTYQNGENLILDLSACISFTALKQSDGQFSQELERLARKAFVDLLEENYKEGEKRGDSQSLALTRLYNRSVCLVCWINRYIPQLFAWYKRQGPPVFLFYGVCSNENEALFLRFLSRMPVDTFEICPDLSLNCKLSDSLLFDKEWPDSLPLGQFPEQIDQIQHRTAAYEAQQDLNTLLYQDTGLYRNKQFKKAIPLQLKTTYEEIAILWDQEARFRSGFEILADRVMVPVICAKVSGVPGGDVYQYWQDISKLLVEDTILLHKMPYISDAVPNPVRPHAAKFLKDGKLQFDKIKEHSSYQYGFIREDMQDYMLDKLQECIDSRIVTGTGSSGTEFTILSVALNLNKGFLRLIQKYDFTKTIPKLVIISTGEETCSLTDSCLAAYLGLLGFDIAIFTPTGYQNVEANFTKSLITEHQVGDYMYDLNVPNLKTVCKSAKKERLRDRLFRRAR